MTIYIYKIELNGKKYVGSTINFKNRIKQHRSDCNNAKSKNHHFRLYKYIRENGGWKNNIISIIDIYDNTENIEKFDIEDYYIKYFNCELNVNDARVDKIKKQQNNKKNCKSRYERVKHTEEYKEYVKQYQEKTRLERLDYLNNYWEKNKEKFNEKITCDCGTDVLKRGLKRHLRTSIHKKKLHLLNMQR